MLMKILLTAAVILAGWLAVRERWRAEDDAERLAGQAGRDRAQDRNVLVPRGAVRLAAYGLVVIMLAGTGVYLFQGWQRDRETVEVQVVNTYTGKIERHEARRGEVDRRSFVTLDGRRVRIAEMERLILLEPER
ncbi:hypothetical protein CKO40_18715 [Halochromatium glycolicum]|jgi:hypothetical protein|uniref:Antitermination protein NusG n=2 Tax=Halochromatium glycolicum TaxID=85075 RepID=A0AAJ0U738_9GAMM|nr:hypothetical protein [Halochromatium glycolicum]